MKNLIYAIFSTMLQSSVGYTSRCDNFLSAFLAFHITTPEKLAFAFLFPLYHFKSHPQATGFAKFSAFHQMAVRLCLALSAFDSRHLTLRVRRTIVGRWLVEDQLRLLLRHDLPSGVNKRAVSIRNSYGILVLFK